MKLSLITKLQTTLMFLLLASCSGKGFWHSDPDGDGFTKGKGYYATNREATGNKVFIFDPVHTSWAAYDEKGKLVNTGKASGGKDWCADIGRSCRTPAGTYAVVREGDKDCKSSKYPIKTNGGAAMPYCMHFGHKGYAIHSSRDVPDGENASHGCVRVTYKSAEWLNKKFIDVGTTVIILPYE